MAMLKLGEPEEKSWNGYDTSKPSFAVLVEGPDGTGILCWTVGAHLRREVEINGCLLDGLGISPPSPGIWIWEGRYVWSGGTYEHPQDGSWDPVGKFRAPTPEEWLAIQKGVCPWNDDEWLTPEARADKTTGSHVTEASGSER